MAASNAKGKPGVKRLTRRDLVLAEEVGQFFYDPFGFVMFAFPWGVKGTRLEKQNGPDDWQIEVLVTLGEMLKAGVGLKDALPVLLAVASGHGIGKTALIAWIILWFISTRQHPQIVVTAGKKDQLMGKTWRELAKWHRMAINAAWFEWRATKLEQVLYPETWNAVAIAWSKNAPENFAGTHEEHVLVIFDEASAIDDCIWEVTDGAMTTPGAVWIAFGNPTRNNGRFAQCFGKFRSIWKTWHIDSRTAKMANRRLLDMWVKMYGEDSDFVRVRVRGQFPRAGDLQFISSEDVAAAIARTAKGFEAYGKVLSVDIARHGMDQSVMCFRQGRKMLKLVKMRIPDLMQIAARVAEAIDEFEPDTVFVDATGMGWGVVDRLRQLNYNNVIGVQTGEKALNPDRFHDRRAELWYAMREWIQDGGSLVDDQELTDELTSVEYGFDTKQRYVLESKDDMRARDLPSPDNADALALSFCAPVAPAKKKRTGGWRDRIKNKSGSRRGGSSGRRGSAMAA